MKTKEPIKHEIVNEDTVFVGTAAEIVLEMRQQAYFERGIPEELYLDQLVNCINRCIKILDDKTIILSGNSFKTKAESFIQELLKIGYFKEA